MAHIKVFLSSSATRRETSYDVRITSFFFQTAGIVDPPSWISEFH